MAKTQQIEIIEMGRLYKVTGSPNLLLDQYALVEIWVAENSSHSGYWRRLKYGNKRLHIADQARRMSCLF